MKAKFFIVPFLPLVVMAAAFAGASQLQARIVQSSDVPALRLDDVRIDQRDGRVRGTARVNFGYAAPFASHVEVDALDAKGAVIFSGCDSLSLQSLTGHPRLPGYRTRGDSFSVRLPADLAGIRRVVVVAKPGHGEGCNPEENRIWNWFKR